MPPKPNRTRPGARLSRSLRPRTGWHELPWVHTSHQSLLIENRHGFTPSQWRLHPFPPRKGGFPSETAFSSHHTERSHQGYQISKMVDPGPSNTQKCPKWWHSLGGGEVPPTYPCKWGHSLRRRVWPKRKLIRLNYVYMSAPTSWHDSALSSEIRWERKWIFLTKDGLLLYTWKPSQVRPYTIKPRYLITWSKIQ
jgi:hypothetical protein